MDTILMILAILLAPVVAIQVSVWLDKRREAEKRKLDIFRSLMATRLTPTYPQHVEALNRIDIEFYGKSKKLRGVQEAWKVYHDHLGAGQPAELGLEEKDSGKKEKLDKEWKDWTSKKEELLTDLLYEMAKYFGYTFDKVHIKRGHYIPRLYGDIEMEQMIIRKGLVRILEHKAVFPIFAFVAEAPAPKELEAIRDRIQKGIESNRRKK